MNPAPDPLAAVREAILVQAEALRRLAGNLPDSCARAVEMILTVRGRVVFSGMGKSGHVARKVAATMSSTGTPALFLHPSESLHGDLGQVTRDDLVFFISKSGENPEIDLMLPTLRRQGVSVVALTSSPASLLGRAADLVIDVGEIQEICPLNLAPTTSATVAMVLIDAMSMELMRRKGFREEDYACFHPAGQLGKTLLFHVRDLMVPLGSCAVLPPGASVPELLRAISKGKMGAALVADGEGRLLGLVTDCDVRKRLEKDLDLASCRARDLMNPAPMTCLIGDSAFEVLLRMRRHKTPITLMPVLEEGRLAGMITLASMVQHGLA